MVWVGLIFLGNYNNLFYSICILKSYIIGLSVLVGGFGFKVVFLKGVFLMWISIFCI